MDYEILNAMKLLHMHNILTVNLGNGQIKLAKECELDCHTCKLDCINRTCLKNLINWQIKKEGI